MSWQELCLTSTVLVSLMPLVCCFSGYHRCQHVLCAQHHCVNAAVVVFFFLKLGGMAKVLGTEKLATDAHMYIAYNPPELVLEAHVSISR